MDAAEQMDGAMGFLAVAIGSEFDGGGNVDEVLGNVFVGVFRVGRKVVDLTRDKLVAVFLEDVADVL